MFDFLQIFFVKVTSVIASVIIAVGLVSMPTIPEEQPKDDWRTSVQESIDRTERRQTTINESPDNQQNTDLKVEVSENQSPPNTILCNGKSWSPCPEGQRSHCPATGDVQCLYENIPRKPTLEDPLIRVERCKIEAQDNIDNFLEVGKMVTNEAFKQCVQNIYDTLQQELGNAIPGTVGTMVDIARSSCSNSAQEGLDKLQIKADEIYNRQYLECLNK